MRGSAFEIPVLPLRKDDGDTSPFHVLATAGAVVATTLLTVLVAVPPGLQARVQLGVLGVGLSLTLGGYLLRSLREPGHALGWVALSGVVILRLVATVRPDLGRWVPLVSLPLVLIAFRAWFRESVAWAGGLRRVLEGGMVAIALFAWVWMRWLASAPLPGVDLAGAVATAILLGTTVYHARVDQRRLLGPLGWVALGLLATGGVDLWRLLQVRGGAPSPYDPVARLLPLAEIPLGLAAWAPWTHDRLSRSQGRGSQLGSMGLVYGPVAIALIALLLDLRAGLSPDPASVLLMATATLLLLARQVLALRDQASFARILGQRLEERTLALEASREAHLRAQRLNLLVTVGAGMAHDLNNLLGAVCTLAEREGPREELVATAHRAAALARRSLAWAGNPKGRLELFDLAETTLLLQPLLKDLVGREVDLSLTCCASGLWVEADPVQVEQVLVNLVTNARDALPGRGRIQITLDQDGSDLRLTVDDDGAGIPPEVLPRIFEPFFTTKEGGAGAGLGLTSVKAFLDLQGGTVTVSTEVGQGSRFVLRWPVQEV